MDSRNAHLFKKAKLANNITRYPVSKLVIGTHNGTFQADEAMGIWMLLQLPAFWHSKIVRTRDISILNDLDLVVDVGGVYDHARLRYDHHQRSYNERFDADRCTKLSASGLIYRHYGKELIKTFYPALTQTQINYTHTKLYSALLEALDAIDTGVEACPAEVKLLYKDITGLASRVSRLNPRWNEVDEDGQRPNEDERFMLAVELCGTDFLSALVYAVESELAAGDTLYDVINSRQEVDASGQIIALKVAGMPWRNHVYRIEKHLEIRDLIMFVLYPDDSGMWRIQCVNVEGKAFETRLSLPEPWRGLRDNDLVKVTGIPGCRFVHAGGFIGGNDSYEGALEMARTVLKLR